MLAAPPKASTGCLRYGSGKFIGKRLKDGENTLKRLQPLHPTTLFSGPWRHVCSRDKRNQPSSLQQAANAALGSSALVIGRPITSWLAPAAIASAGPITRA